VGADTSTIALLGLGVVLVWLIAWWRIRTSYTRELGRNLRRLHVDQDQASLSLRERGLLRQMLRLLDSPYERVVMHGMDLLEDNGRRLLEKRLPELLQHSSPRVRARVLRLLAEIPAVADPELVRRMLNDRDAGVRLEAHAGIAIVQHAPHQLG